MMADQDGSASLVAKVRGMEARWVVFDSVDVLLSMLDDGIFVTPTLAEVSPTPMRIVGSLNDREAVARLLGLRRE